MSMDQNILDVTEKPKEEEKNLQDEQEIFEEMRTAKKQYLYF